MSVLIAPSILSADFAALGEAIAAVERGGADLIHVDVMDGHFVPNITIGVPVVKSLRRIATVPLDVHLMIEEPERYAEAFKKAGADRLIVHLEACRHLHRNIQQIKSLGMKAVVALNPHSPADLLCDVLQDLDGVLVMSVNPGFGGQEFIPHTFQKIRNLRRMIHDRGLDTLIEIDGGVTLENAASLVKSGADVLVAGNTVFSSPDPKATIYALKYVD